MEDAETAVHMLQGNRRKQVFHRMKNNCVLTSCILYIIIFSTISILVTRSFNTAIDDIENTNRSVICEPDVVATLTKILDSVLEHTTTTTKWRKRLHQFHKRIYREYCINTTTTTTSKPSE